jgi:terminal uridylyltransferase
MRAHRVFQARPDRAIVALSQLCEERQQEELPPLGAVSFIPPRPPPQTPYTVGGSSMRPQVVPAPIMGQPTPTIVDDGPAAQPDVAQTRVDAGTPISDQITAAVTASVGEDKQSSSLPPDHMAPRRSQYTSPPPPDAPLAEFVSFEDMLDQGLSMATAATEARERERDRAGETSASASEIFTEDGRISDVADLDDVRSVRSFSEDSSSTPQWSPQPPLLHAPSMAYSYSSDAGLVDTRKLPSSPLSTGWKPQKGAPSLRVASFRGRKNASGKDDAQDAPSPTSRSDAADPVDWTAAGPPARRSTSGPPKAFAAHRYSMTAADGYVPVQPFAFHRPPHLHSVQTTAPTTSTVFYETGSGKGSQGGGSGSNSPIAMPASPAAAYAAAAAVANARPYPTMMPYPTPLYPHHLMDPRMFAYSAAAAVAAAASVPAVSALEAAASPASFARWGVSPHEHLAAAAAVAASGEGSGSSSRQRTGSGPKTPTPGTTANGGSLRRKGSHSYSHSTATVVPAPDSTHLRPPPSDCASFESRSPEPMGPKSTRPSSRSRSRKPTANGNGNAASETVETPKQEGFPDPSRAQAQALLTPDRWSPMSRRADSPHSLGTDSPAPSSPASSHYVTSPSTSPPSPAALEPKRSPPPSEERLVETPVAERKPVALADPGSAENTPVGSSFTQVPATPS